MQINNRSNPPIIMESAKGCSSSSSLLLLFLLASSTSCLSSPARKPCKSFSFFFHDILYNGQNAENATSAIVAAPEGANRTILAGEKHFGNVVVFDDPVTAENHLRSPPIGRAQGLYLYDRKDVYTAWFGFTFVLDSAEHGRGTINIAGADPLMNKTRDVSVVGGTGDFFMARGVATLSTDAFEGEVYFRLKVDVNLYECWLN